MPASGRPGRFACFLSHTAAHKVRVAALKRQLGIYKVSSFIAHEDIEPSLEWQIEIERALSSAHALAAVITSDFHASDWTAQEIGYALGRGLIVVPLKAPDNPRGFVAKIQGVPVDLTAAPASAEAVVDALLRRPETRALMRSTLLSALAAARSFDDAGAVGRKVAGITDWTADELLAIEAAMESNDQVSGSRKAHGWLDPLLRAMPGRR